jgi:hypothetical protein
MRFQTNWLDHRNVYSLHESSAGRNPPTNASPRPTVIVFGPASCATGTPQILSPSSFFNSLANMAPSGWEEDVRLKCVWPFVHNIFMAGSQEPVKYYLYAHCPALQVKSVSKNLRMPCVLMLLLIFFRLTKSL